LIDAEDDRHLWSEAYDRPLTAENVFAIQDEIARAIVAALSEVLDAAPPRARTAAATTDLSAYDLYLEARALYQDRTQIERTEALLAQAVGRDPEFADAWALRAAVASLFGEYVKTDIPPNEIGRRVDEYALRARELDPENSLAFAAPPNFRMHATLNLVERYDIGGIIADLNKAVDLGPQDSSVRNWLGLTYLAVGAMERALETFTACTEVDPLFGPCAENLYDGLVALERYEEAWTLFQRVLSRGMKVGGWVNFSLLAHFDEKTAFMIAADHDQWLAGWRRQDEIYDAFKNPGADHSALAADLTEFVRDNPQINRQTIGILLIPVGAFDFRPYPTTLWAPDHARYRRSPQFHDYIVKSGTYDYWREHGFPPQCRPKGSDDFECD
jgi:Flp pilus assembly protein TadD